jgi:spore coat polysaccharide biosynthesis predicted glycosyltransferase SpsG
MLDKYDYSILDWLLEKDTLINIIENSDVILIDSYKASLTDYETISQHTKVCSFLDDNIRINYPEGIIINGTVGSEKFEYPKSDKKKYLLGSLYIPLRQEFWDSFNAEKNEKVQSIIITMGGQDIRNLTPKILNWLNLNFPSMTKHVIIGNGFPSVPEIEANMNEQTHLYYAPNAEKMKDIMLNSDIAISAAGQPIYELAKIGIPTFAIGVADNQRNNIYEWSKVGFVRNYSWWNDIKLFDKMGKYIYDVEEKSVRSELSFIGNNYVDGNGSRRITSELIKDYIDKESFYIRNAGPEDCKVIYDLSNDDLVRENSINRTKIL